MSDHLDVIGTGALLRVLTDFAEPAPTFTRAYPEALWRELEALAAMERAPRGSVRAFAKKYGKPHGSLTAQIHAIRRGTRPMPQYRRDA